MKHAFRDFDVLSTHHFNITDDGALLLRIADGATVKARRE